MHKQHVETRLAQLTNRSGDVTGAVNSPIYLSTAFEHQGLGQSTGYDYTRTQNPTRYQLEKEFADLAAADKAYACSSGMSAIQLVLGLFKSGDTLIAADDIYGGTYRLLKHYDEHFNIRTIYHDFKNHKEIEKIITADTQAMLIETPTNPLMQEIDITHAAELCHRHDLLLIVDNTFLTPYRQRPLEMNADIVIHSATKYLGGHNDVLGGLAAARGPAVCEQLSALHNASGSVLSPFDSWLLMRGMKTLALRMDKHEQNAEKIAAFLNDEPKITDVLYPGKGGMLSFRLKNSTWVDPFLQELELITFAESLGGTESFITYPATQTHADMPEKERIERGVDDRLLRFSVGIEQSDDLISDLKQALSHLSEDTI